MRKTQKNLPLESAPLDSVELLQAIPQGRKVKYVIKKGNVGLYRASSRWPATTEFMRL
jgi:hypothetical protein